MRKLFIIFGLLSSSVAWSQQKGPQTEQAACYRQARQYVADSSSEEFKSTFESAHFEPKTQTCYVEMTSAISNSSVISVTVADAYEGRTIAQCVHPLVGDNKPLEYCQVNGEKAASRAIFNDLLWKLIPAFEPVTSHFH